MAYDTYAQIISGVVEPMATWSTDGQVQSGTIEGTTVYVYPDVYEFDATGVEHKFQLPNYSIQYINAQNLSLGVKCNAHRYGYNIAFHCYAKDRHSATVLADHLENTIRDIDKPWFIQSREMIWHEDWVKVVCIMRGLASS